MLFGIIIVAVAVLVAYLLNKSKVSEIKTEAPDKIEPAIEDSIEEIIETPVKKVKAPAKKKTTKNR